MAKQVQILDGERYTYVITAKERTPGRWFVDITQMQPPAKATTVSVPAGSSNLASSEADAYALAEAHLKQKHPQVKSFVPYPKWKAV